ncbi:MAG: substrate-binding domain-containing protein, partial [Bacteroidota bacterium]|nr:substrate-binding domain-containing protein [Bacteroidota bacterium]
MKFSRLIGIFGIAAIMASCSSEDKNGDSGAGGQISIDGSSTVYPITEAVAEEYRREGKNTRVTIGVSGTGGGFKKFSRGDIDINNASRMITEDEAKVATETNISYTPVKVAF